MNPLLPHITSEYLEKLDMNENVELRNLEKKYILSDVSEIVIQVNGKKRNTISIKRSEEKFIVENIKNKTTKNI